MLHDFFKHLYVHDFSLEKKGVLLSWSERDDGISCMKVHTLFS
jgi:hypothetical protein